MIHAVDFMQPALGGGAFSLSRIMTGQILIGLEMRGKMLDAY